MLSFILHMHQEDIHYLLGKQMQNASGLLLPPSSITSQ